MSKSTPVDGLVGFGLSNDSSCLCAELLELGTDFAVTFGRPGKRPTDALPDADALALGSIALAVGSVALTAGGRAGSDAREPPAGYRPARSSRGHSR